MGEIYTDAEIAALIAEPKRLTEKDLKRFNSLKDHGAYRRAQISLMGEHDTCFTINLRQSRINPNDFSVILSVPAKDSTKSFRLRRYNGNSHAHGNRIENQQFRGFHIHTATKRYQELGGDEEAYAEATTRYNSFHDAVVCLFEDCGFVLPDAAKQEPLFK